MDKGFFHKDAGDDAPAWIKSKKIFSESAHKEIDYLICNDKTTLAYLNNLGCIELNPWNSTVRVLDKPDYVIVDIDPSDKNTFAQVIKTALLSKQFLIEQELIVIEKHQVPLIYILAYPWKKNICMNQ